MMLLLAPLGGKASNGARGRYLKSGMGPVRNLNDFLLKISNGVGKRYLKNRLKRFLSLTG